MEKLCIREQFINFCNSCTKEGLIKWAEMYRELYEEFRSPEFGFTSDAFLSYIFNKVKEDA